MPLTLNNEIILKYDVPGPRYTSYPTVPKWSSQVNASCYQQVLKRFEKTSKTLSLYVHIPFCQSLCYFCGCMTVIRKRDDRYGDVYLNYLFQEISLLREFLGNKKTVKQLHFGGGTPTYLTESQLERLC